MKLFKIQELHEADKKLCWKSLKFKGFTIFTCSSLGEKITFQKKKIGSGLVWINLVVRLEGTLAYHMVWDYMVALECLHLMWGFWILTVESS